MQNELNQEEIDAMVRAARTGGAADASKKKEPRVEPWDVRRAGQIGREQLLAITQLHEGFARSLTTALGTYLRVVFSAALVSAEHLTYREFIDRIPETTYMAAILLEPMGVHGAMQLDLKVAFPIIDLLLGGQGAGLATTREITDIEDPIVESVARIVCRELGAAWQAVKLEVQFEKRMELPQAQRLMPGNEKILSLSFEVSLLEVRGGLNLAVPVSLSHALLRKISAEPGDGRPRGASVWREMLKLRLLECSFPLALEANALTATVGELTAMAAGTVLPLRRSAAQPVSLMVAGVEMCSALPARVVNWRAAQIVEMLAPAAENPSEGGEGAP
jgi:flagellar motor switch protein FliM